MERARRPPARLSTLVLRAGELYLGGHRRPAGRPLHWAHGSDVSRRGRADDPRVALVTRHEPARSRRRSRHLDATLELRRDGALEAEPRDGADARRAPRGPVARA